MFLKLLNNRFFKIFFFGLCFAILFSKSDRNFFWTNGKVSEQSAVMSDGSGYYGYLPQWFTYGTKHFEFASKIVKKYPGKRYVDFSGNPLAQQEAYNKYYSGTAVALTPFYLAGDLHAKWGDKRQDGYSWPYLFWTNIGILFFAVFGAFGLFRLTQLYKVHPLGGYLVVLGVLFATNLCYYTTVEIPFSHTFSFALNTWFLVHAKQWSTNKKNKHFYWLSALLGWVIIIRPTNIFILFFVPFLFQSTRAFGTTLKELFLNRKKQLVIGISLFAAFIAFHLWNVHTQTGSFSMNSYSNEGFDNWKDPFIWDVLFSYKKGFFVYAPIMFLLFPAMLVCWFKQRRLFWGTLVIFALVTYSSAAWWMWFFGGGLGARNYIDFMAVFFLAIAVMYQHVHWTMKWGLLAATAIGIWMYQVYDYQMRKMILHYDTISKEGFWDVFMETDLRFQYHIVTPYDKEPATRKNVGKTRFMIGMDGKEIQNKVYEIQKNYFDDDPRLGLRTKSICNSAKKIGVEFNVDVRIYDHFTKPAFFVFAYKNDSLIETRSIQFGGMIRNQDEFSSPKLFFNLNSKWNEVDSLGVWLDQSMGNIGVKNTRVQFYTH